MNNMFKCVQRNVLKVLKCNTAFYCTITPVCRPGTYKVEPVGECDATKVINMLKRTFYIDEPLSAAVGLVTSPNDNCPELDKFCCESLLDGVSLKAVDSNDNVVGATISGIEPLKEEEGNDLLSLAQSCKNPKFQKILLVLAQRDKGVKLWEKYPQEKRLLQLKIAATDPTWRKRGIMNALVKRTEIAAKHSHIKLVRMEATSAYAAICAQTMGFECVYKVLYKDIKMDGQPIIVPKPPHVEFRVYVKEIC